jgi:hypothetical protein
MNFLLFTCRKLGEKSITHNFIFASRQNPESPLSYNAVHLIFSEIDKVFHLTILNVNQQSALML